MHCIHIHPLQIDKELCECQNVSTKFRCALLFYLSLSSRHLLIFFLFLFLFLIHTSNFTRKLQALLPKHCHITNHTVFISQGRCMLKGTLVFFNELNHTRHYFLQFICNLSLQCTSINK